MIRGRRPVPTKLQLVHGNPRKTTDLSGKLEAEVKPDIPPKAPPPPRELNKNRVAQREWKRVIQHLYRLGLYTEIDAVALVNYCLLYSSWLEALGEVQEHGMVYFQRTEHGGRWIQNPWDKVALEKAKEMRMCLVEFGMTPSSRSRVKPADAPKTESTFEKFMQKRG